MATAQSSLARRQFDDVLSFSTALNETFSALSVLPQLPRDRATQVMRQTLTFMLLVTVGAFDAFLTERCRELRIRPTASRKGRRVSPERALFGEKLHALRAAPVPADVWKARVEDAYELHYKARTLWIHGAGLPGSVRDQPRDLSVFEQDLDGRYWVSECLWSGCVGALRGLADDCR